MASNGNSTVKRATLDDLAPVFEAYETAKAHEAEWGKLAKQAEQQLADRLAEQGAAIGTIDGRDVVRRSPVAGRTSLDMKRLRADLPAVFEEYKRVGEPSFRFSRIED